MFVRVVRFRDIRYDQMGGMAQAARALALEGCSLIPIKSAESREIPATSLGTPRKHSAQLVYDTRRRGEESSAKTLFLLTDAHQNLRAK